MTNHRWPRSNPAGFLRKYRDGGRTQSEEYDFHNSAWERTTFFLDHDRGHIDYDYEEVPAAEAEALIQEKHRRKAERDLQQGA
ncbi:hypothetical protein [Glycomyces sp. NPDC047010]|uniref:hypothetical protein n=1 Tax=Glycomyces sp. NPDC047010 TaxID=3155023 RepID=UPI00340D33F3